MSAGTITYTFEKEPRTPLVVIDGWIDAGGHSRRFKTGNTKSLLTSYVKLIRSMRKAHPRTTVNLRVSDIRVIADYLAEDTATVVDWLADVIGAPRIERARLASLLAGGAAVVTLVTTSAAGSTAVHLADSIAAAPVAGSEQLVDAPAVAPVVAAVAPIVATPVADEEGLELVLRPTSRLRGRWSAIDLDALRRPARLANAVARRGTDAAIGQTDRELAEVEVNDAPIIVVTDEDGNESSIFTPPLPPEPTD